MRTVIFIMLLGLTIGATGCGPTKYHRQRQLFGTSNYGFREMQLSKNSYIIEYYSNPSTTNMVNRNHALRRAAELTRASEYKYFVIVKERDISTLYKAPPGKSKDLDIHTEILSEDIVVKPGIQMTIEMVNSRIAKSFIAEEVYRLFL